MALMALGIDKYDITVTALAFAFPSYDDLNIMMRSKLGKRLSTYAAPDAMPTVLDKLIGKAESEGWIEALLIGAMQQNPNNPLLRELAPVLMLTGEGAPTERLQAIVLGNNELVDIGEWRAGIERAEKSVCRFQAINNKKAKGFGSGFLIADDVVMTNRHVVDLLLDPRLTAPTVQFDYIEDADGNVTIGPQFALETGTLEDGNPAWLLGSSPVNELDYALIRLPQGTGRMPVPTPGPYVFTNGDVYFIVQHPAGQPMKIGGGTLVSTAATPPRVNYTTNTLGGSSGSPVFTTAWQPVALHRAGSNDEKFNSGVPLATIVDHARVGGFWPATAT